MLVASGKIVALLFLLVQLSEQREQYVNVKGTLVCKGEAIENARVELWERDFLSPDDLLNAVNTDIMGEFHLTGSDSEYLDIKPFLVVKHFCNSKPNCLRETKVDIKASSAAEVVVALPAIEMAGLQQNEDEECFI